MQNTASFDISDQATNLQTSNTTSTITKTTDLTPKNSDVSNDTDGYHSIPKTMEVYILLWLLLKISF